MNELKNHPFMKKVLKDSYGGICYDHDNLSIYNKQSIDEVVYLWNSLSDDEKNSNGIIKGAINFLMQVYND